MKYAETFQSLKDDKLKEDKAAMYLIEQINFYADLALSRNYLWRTHLERIFP
jgi:hypothetical protein